MMMVTTMTIMMMIKAIMVVGMMMIIVVVASLRMADVSPCLSSLRDVSRRGTSATKRQKFHTDDAKSIRNLVRSANWSTE